MVLTRKRAASKSSAVDDVAHLDSSCSAITLNSTATVKQIDQTQNNVSKKSKRVKKINAIPEPVIQTVEDSEHSNRTTTASKKGKINTSKSGTSNQKTKKGSATNGTDNGGHVEDTKLAPAKTALQSPDSLCKPSTSIVLATAGTSYSDASSESDVDWEEVPEANPEQVLEDYNPVIPEGGVEITVESNNKKKRKKKGFDFALYARRQLNRFKKDVQISMHKVHLLCWISHGMFLNQLLNSEELKCLALSISPEEFTGKTSRETSFTVRKMVQFFRNFFTLKYPVSDTCENTLDDLYKSSPQNLLVRCYEEKETASTKYYCLLFISWARALNLDTRLCFAAYPISFKASDLIKPKKVKCITLDDEPESKPSAASLKSGGNSSDSKPSSSKQVKTEVPVTDTKLHVRSINGKGPTQKSTDTVNDRLGRKTKKSTKKPDLSDSLQNVPLLDSSRRRRQQAKKAICYKESDNDTGSDEDYDAKEMNTSKRWRDASVSEAECKVDSSSDSDADDFKLLPPKSSTKRRSIKTASKSDNSNSSTAKSKDSKTSRKSSVKIVSSDSDGEVDDSIAKPDSVNYWAEIYVKEEKKWLCVDVVNGDIDKPNNVEKNLCKSSSYFIGIDKEFHLKDLTKKYVSNWLTTHHKERVDPDWWDETIDLYKPPIDSRFLEEEKYVQAVLLDKPMPKTVSEYKNHPLYALKRHLLKFEGIYPPDAPSLGFIRQEPVYARECVHTLRSRETWMKQAKVVKKGEMPYKVVKARPKWDKIMQDFKTDLPLEIFGPWQVEDYVPPPAKDGIVPRNEYGNIELFQPSMLPAGTVHLQLPGLNRIARKLGLDAAPALVGFEGHCGGVRPVFDGFVVCTEFKETLLAAWDEEQENIRKREDDKREKRIYDNWKKLIKGLLIRERIKLKYGKEEA